jgi:hypothetical protein
MFARPRALLRGLASVLLIVAAALAAQAGYRWF